ncbi:MAG: hypothetical protein HZB87_02615, partial [Desulfatitalea sp.]|nr:hypothetical protein [Desulfatitalea sp.]
MTMLNKLIFLFHWRVLLLTATLCSIVGVHPLHAALLKDVRLGEYKTFTRIVFELDKAPPTIPDISGNPDELRVIFQDIAVDLVRKIPIKQSPHVKGVQIWLKANQLSAVFKVDTPFAHSKISSMSNPPRLLVDINWQTSAQRP